MTKQQLSTEIKIGLKMNHSVSQSLKALQLSSIALEEFIDNQVLENPFLIKEIKSEYINYDTVGSSDYSGRYRSNNDMKNFDFSNNLEHVESLKQYLLRQIACRFTDVKQKLIAALITDYLNDDGYLTESLESIARNLNISVKLVEKITEALRDMEPVGIYASNLSECLTLQLKDKNIYDTALELILQNLELVAMGNIKALMKITSCSREKIVFYINQIKRLEPKPGRNFISEKACVKVPDAYITINDCGQIVVTSNNTHIPEIKVDTNLYQQSKSQITNNSDKEYVHQMFHSALGFLRSLEMRGKTIALVASAIAKEQEEFFRRGVMYLKPLTLSQIASITGYNESTISRATTDKYLSTSYGVLEMKYFFSSGVKSRYSKEEVSSHKVKEIIKSIISQESKDHPLSDEAITISLKQFNIMIARRTVAKYRESIGILGRSDRKKEYSKDLCLS